MHLHQSPLPTIKAFTLVELLVVLAIIVCCCTFGFSSLYTHFKNNQIEFKVKEISDAVQFARTQAILLDKHLSLIPWPNLADWSSGMALIIDNGKHVPSADSDFIHVWQWPSSKITIHWKGFHSKRYLLFAPSIRKNAVNGTFTLQIGSIIERLQINRLARVNRVTSKGS